MLYSIKILWKIGVDEGEGVDKNSDKKWKWHSKKQKKWCSSSKFFYVLCFVAQSPLLGFSRSSDSITASNKKSHPRAISISEVTI